MFEGTVIGAFGIGRKTAGGQLSVFNVILQAIAAKAFARARFIAAVAALEIFILFAVHNLFPSMRFFHSSI